MCLGSVVAPPRCARWVLRAVELKLSCVMNQGEKAASASPKNLSVWNRGFDLAHDRLGTGLSSVSPLGKGVRAVVRIFPNEVKLD